MEAKSTAVRGDNEDHRAAAARALHSALDATEKALESLPDEGGKEHHAVKGARGMLLGVKDNLAAALEKVEG